MPTISETSMTTSSARSNQQTASETLRSAIDPALPVALLDYPDHSNVGDSAIWSGEMKFLTENRYDLRYVCDYQSFNEKILRHVMPRGQILLHGGGNFGTVWPIYQVFRESIAARMPDYRIVQLPQSIHFDNETSIGRTKQALAAHPDFLMMVRDRESLDFATTTLALKAVLCPDSALILHGDLKREKPDVDILVLARTDKESQGSGLDKASLDGYTLDVVDWIEEPKTLTRKFARLAKRIGKSSWGASPGLQSIQSHFFHELANQRIKRGTELLSRGRIVVTDRLHAHILCVLLGIEHIVIDNSYGKVTRFISCWTHDNPLVHVVKSPAEAMRLASQILAQNKP